MSYNYSNLQSMSSRLIEKSGRQITFNRVEGGEYIPSKSTVVNGVSTSYTAYCVQRDWSKIEKQQNDILQDDVRLVCQVADYKKEDVAVIDGENFQIYDIEKVQPASDKLLYILQMRK